MSSSKTYASYHLPRLANLPLTAIFIGLALCRPAYGQMPLDSPIRSWLEVGKIFDVSKSLGSGDSYLTISRLVADRPEAPGSALTAFEENQSFVYAVGRTNIYSGSNQGQELRARLIRRIIVLKPSVMVVDDEIRAMESGSPVEWCLHSRNPAKIFGREGEIIEEAGELSWETLFPTELASRQEAPAHGQAGSENIALEVPTRRNSGNARFIHVFNIQEHGKQIYLVHSALTADKDEFRLTVSAKNRFFHLVLPPPEHGAGMISISTSDHKTVLESRPLAAGILPHGPEGTRLLDLWDSDYRGSRPPMWDIGRPSNELMKVVKEGTVRRCRVVDLCCGSGTDAIYLAGKGFDVTGIDIAPTALSQARRKAAAAGVSVQWLFADVLKPPTLDPFDFIYDRGCYHVVRDQNLAAYIETLRLLSRPGTRFLLLASRANEHEANATTSGVTEEEIRYDFLKLFDIEWLREIKLESNREEGADPPGWSALFHRNGER